MIGLNANQASYNSFDFSFKTSSGDKISLSMYDNKQMSVSSVRDKNSSMDSFSLTHSYGYSFQYRGNGLDENDKKEIAKALEKVEGDISKFMKNVNESGIPSPKSILNVAQDIKQELPEVNNEDKKLALHDELLKLFDIKLQEHFPNEDVLKSAKSLFDKINEQLESFLLYV